MLDENQLTGTIPESVGKCVDMTDCVLNNNNLTGAIPDMSQCIKLKDLSLDANQLSGTVTESLANCAALTELGLARTNLTITQATKDAIMQAVPGKKFRWPA